MTRGFAYDTLGPLVGFRAWRTTACGLASPVVPAAWPPGRPIAAACEREGGPAPHPGCACGIYALKDVEALRRYVLPCLSPDQLFPLGDAPRRSEIVIGPVRLWGRVFEHELGWRAELAYPAGLFSLRPDDPVIAPLLESYEIPGLLPPIPRRPPSLISVEQLRYVTGMPDDRPFDASR